MRKAIIAAIVATALFAVGAFAASFTLEAENVSSQATTVGSCAAKAVINWDTSPEISTAVTPNDYLLTGATVTFFTSGNAVENGCSGAKIDLAINNGTNWVNVPHVTAGGSTNTVQFDLSTLGIPVRTVVGASVLADGAPITTPASA